MTVSRLCNALAPAVFAIVLSASARAVDVVGTQVTLGWTPASGPVSGYYVIVARDAGTAKVESVTIETKKTLTGTIGETLVVQVAAFSQDGVAGPLSPPSSPITFVASGSDGTTTPPPDGGAGEPPPDGGGGGDGGGSTPDDTRITEARDFNGDGRADLVVRTGSDLRIWVMQGSSVASEIPLPLAPNGSRVVGTGDYDGNLNADLLWEDSQTGDITLWLLSGGVVVGTGALDRSDLPAGEEWRVGGSGDFDGDGADDLMLFSRVKGEVETWTFAGASVASRVRLPGHTGAWTVVAVDDTDADGMAEIIWLDELHRVLELRDPAAAAPVKLGDLASGWRGRGAVDLAGDGSAELVMQHTLGATQAWALDDSGIVGASDLANAQSLGRFSGGGDFDGDGSEDVTWTDVSDGAVTLWLAGSGASTPVVVNRSLPAGGDVVSGSTTSLDTAFRQRFCSGDLDGSGHVNGKDFKIFKSCLNHPRTAACNLADMDSDGMVTTADYEIFRLRFTGNFCEAW